jgi:hypothetical protein
MTSQEISPNEAEPSAENPVETQSTQSTQVGNPQHLVFVPKATYASGETQGTEFFTGEVKDYVVHDNDDCWNFPYAEYEIQFKRGKLSWQIYRRYSEFDNLIHYLAERFVKNPAGEEVYLPDLPPKTYFNCAYDYEYIETRRILLDKFLERLFTTAMKHNFLEDATLLEFFEIDPHLNPREYVRTKSTET